VVNAQSSIPAHPIGYTLGNEEAPVHLDAYFDFLCPYSAVAYPTIKSLISSYAPTKLKFTMTIFPLPYHHNAFFAAQSGAVVAHFGKDIWKWTELIFQNQAQWFNYASMNLTSTQVIDGMADLAVQCGVTKEQFNKQFPLVEQECRAAYSVTSAHGVYGTPLFYINGAFQWADSKTTEQQWQNIINNVLVGYEGKQQNESNSLKY